MITEHVSVPALHGEARLRLPDWSEPDRALITLHGAELPGADQPLFEHLAEAATPLGYAVLSYDRRHAEAGDVPLRHQVEDALTALRWTAAELGVPVGLFGFSQGAWAATLAAARDAAVAALVLVGCSGVSPAAQMRYFTDEALRRNGYAEEDREELRAARTAVESVLREDDDRERAGQLLAQARRKPWFDLAHLPAELPPADRRWDDMDYDPVPTFVDVVCPTLLLYGEDEECVPAAESKAAWRSAATRADLTIVDVPGCGHFPSLVGAGQEIGDISPAYTELLTSWLGRSLA